MDSATLTASQAAAELGVTKVRVNALNEAGRLKAEKFGRDWMIKRADLAAVKGRKPGRPPKAGPSKPNASA